MKSWSFTQQWWRIGGACGIAFIIVFIISIAFEGESPTYDDPIEEIRAYWESDGETYLITDYLRGLATMLLILPFLVCLRAYLGRAEGSPEILVNRRVLRRPAPRRFCGDGSSVLDGARLRGREPR